MQPASAYQSSQTGEVVHGENRTTSIVKDGSAKFDISPLCIADVQDANLDITQLWGLVNSQGALTEQNLPIWYSLGPPVAIDDGRSDDSFTQLATTAVEEIDQASVEDSTDESAYSESLSMETDHLYDQKTSQAGFEMEDHAGIANPTEALANDSTAIHTSSFHADPHAQTHGPVIPLSSDAPQCSGDFEQARSNAARGDVSGMLELGGYYFHGEGGASQDFLLAMSWFQRAASRGSAAAQFNIATMYRQGHGVLPNITTAWEWYLKAAKQGHADAEYSLGLLYFNGEGMGWQYLIAMAWFLKSAKQMNPSALIALGMMYHFGIGVREDDKKAQEYYDRALGQKINAARAKRNGISSSDIGVTGDCAVVEE
ncbi:hypothetical protein EC991_005751 [Linnemannia zychae]|nr:hypothetical protein EC991_005751 [Linnemannia zychae]